MNLATDLSSTPSPHIDLAGQIIPIRWRRNPRARRYILRFQRPACVVATIPRGGSQREAFAFIQRSQPWLERQLAKKIERPIDIWFRGQKVPATQFGTPHIGRYLRALAKVELTPRTFELARQTNSQITRVSIRNQRTRWGSCSTKRAINLNWRLIQTPQHVIDYIILHELMHLRQMNHSEKFWREVESVCPTWREAELWLKQNGREIMSAF